MKLFNKIFKNDSYAFGTFLGLVSPIAFLYVFFYGFIFFGGLFNFRPFPIEKLYLLALIINVLYMRLYLVNFKLVKTGKALVVVTFLYVIAYFIFESRIT
jgi:hypothetical protein